MKKYPAILLILPLIFFVNQPAFAKKRTKTQGFQIQADTIYSFARHRYSTDKNYVSTTKFNDSALGGGGSIKYVYNIDNILPAEPLIPVFIFTEIFGQKIGTSALDKEKDRININSRYGMKIGLGSDVADDLFIYISGGVASVNYEIDWQSVNKNKAAHKAGLIYGGGIGYHLGKNLIISLEVNNQSLELRTPKIPTGNDEYGNIIKARTGLIVTQIGLGFQF